MGHILAKWLYSLLFSFKSEFVFETPKASLIIIYLIALKKGVLNSLQSYSVTSVFLRPMLYLLSSVHSSFSLKARTLI